MEVLQVTSNPIYPPENGGNHRSHGLVCAFPDVGDTVHRVCQGGLLSNHGLPSINGRIEVRPGYVEHRPINPFHDLASLPPTLFNVPNVFIGEMLRIWPPRQLKRLLPSADIVIVEGPLQVPAISSMTVDTPIVYSSHNIEADRFQYLRDEHLGGKAYRRLCRLEELAVRRSSAVLCTAETDRERYLNEFDPSGPVLVAPNGVYREDVSARANQQLDIHERYGIPVGDTVAVFIGSNYPPNVDAARFLIDNNTSFADKGIHVLLVGNVCSELEDMPDNVTAAGFVDDLQGHLQEADVGLNPVVSGGGSNIKLLDYFAVSLPVVSTHFGVEGFDVEDGHHLLVRDRPAFANAIKQLGDADERVSIGRHAREYVLNNHVWESISLQVRQNLADILLK